MEGLQTAPTPESRTLELLLWKQDTPHLGGGVRTEEDQDKAEKAEIQWLLVPRGDGCQVLVVCAVPRPQRQSCAGSGHRTILFQRHHCWNIVTRIFSPDDKPEGESVCF